MRLQRDQEDNLTHTQPMEAALKDLDRWVKQVGPAVRQRGFVLDAWFDIRGDTSEDGGEMVSKRIAATEVRFPRPGWAHRLKEAIESLLVGVSGQEIVVPTKLLMAARIARGALEVTREGDSDDDESGGGGAGNGGYQRDKGSGGSSSKKRPGPKKKNAEKTTKKGKRAHTRKLFAKGSSNFSSLEATMVRAVFGNLRHRGPSDEMEKQTVGRVMQSFFELNNNLIADGDWQAQLDEIERKYVKIGLGVTVYDEAMVVVHEPAEGNSQFHLCFNGEEFRAITDATAWCGTDTALQCSNCGYTTSRGHDLAKHVKAGSCFNCPHCTLACCSPAGLAEHLSTYDVAPCAPPLSDPTVRCAALPKHRHDSIVWDIETRPDAMNRSRAIVICAKLSPSLQGLMSSVRFENVGGMTRAAKGTDKWRFDDKNDDSPFLFTRCIEATEGDQTAVARAVFEQFLATLDCIEEQMSSAYKWNRTSFWSAFFYVMNEWFFVMGGEMPTSGEDAGIECVECNGEGEGEGDDEGTGTGEGKDVDEEGDELRETMDLDTVTEDEIGTCAPKCACMRCIRTRKHAAWHRKTKLRDRKVAYASSVVPALVEAAHEAGITGRGTISTTQKFWVHPSEDGEMDTRAREGFDRLIAELKEQCGEAVANYIGSRAAVFARLYDKRYRALRADKPVQMLAHNSSGFDSVALLDHLCFTDRLSCERQAMARKGLAHDPEHDVFTTLRRGDDTKVLDTGNERFLDVKYRGMFHFRDSCRQLNGSLESLGAAFKTSTLKWAAFPHNYFKCRDVNFTDKEEVYKPDRKHFQINRAAPKRENPMKHKRRTLLDSKEYKMIPGKCKEDRLLHGPDGSTYNCYRECVEYCLDDCECLSQCWEKWRDAVVNLTRDDGSDLAHTPLVDGDCTVISIDPGTQNCGVAVVRLEGEFKSLIQWDLLSKLGEDAGAALVAYAKVAHSGKTALHVIVEQPTMQNTDTLAQTASIVREFEAVGVPVHRVDPGYPKHLDQNRIVFPTPTHAENKAWASKFAPAFLGTVPPWPIDKKQDDVCDAALMAWWWVDSHRTLPKSRTEPPLVVHARDRSCQCCLKRFHTHGVDPNAMLTSGQLTLAVCKTELQCTEIQLVDDTWFETQHYKPRFLPMTELPQSFDALALYLGLERVEQTAKVRKLPWGRIRHSGQLQAAVKLLGADDSAMEKLRKLDSHLIPVLNEEMDTFVRRAVYGGRTEPYENLFEPQYRTAKRGAGGERVWEELSTKLNRGDTHFKQSDCEWDLYYYDLCSQYPTELMGDLPCGEGRWCLPNELDQANANPEESIKWLVGFYGFLEVDVVVNKTHSVWGRYPVLPERMKLDGAKTLAWTCTDKTKQVYFSEELKKAISCGNVVVKVHRALGFERSRYLKQFIDVFRSVKEDIDRKPPEERNPAMRQAVKDILNMLYGKTLQMIRSAESLLVDATRFGELVIDQKKELLYLPRVVRDDGENSCFTLTVAKPWAPARGLPPCIGAAVLGNSKVRWYTMLEAGVSQGMIPVTGDTDSLMFAAPKGITLDTWRPDQTDWIHLTDTLAAELGDGIVSDADFGKASNEVPDHRILAIGAPLAKFYSLLMSKHDGSLLVDEYLPQTLRQLKERLCDRECEVVRTMNERAEVISDEEMKNLSLENEVISAMLEHAEAMSDDEMKELAPCDKETLTLYWARRFEGGRGKDFDSKTIMSVVTSLEITHPYVYTKIKSILLQGNESLLGYREVRRLMLETHKWAIHDNPELAKPTIEVTRSQLKKRTEDGLHLCFESAPNCIGANYVKRKVLQRNTEWEDEHHATRITTIPSGYVGPVW
jgi:hypothetical protein